MKHLWEIEHPYYCNEGNYFASESVETSYESWSDFLDEWGDADFDMNLLFRWDWRKADPEGDKWGNKQDQLLIFWMGQRKGKFCYSCVTVTDNDEPAVKKWLTPRWHHLRLLWEGISDYLGVPE